MSSVHHLLFTLPLSIYSVSPTIQAERAAVTAIAGTNTTLRCTVTGDPIPIQTWTRNGISLSDSRFQIQSGGSELFVRNVIEDDEGQYQCHASNSAGSVSATVDLNVISEYDQPCDDHVLLYMTMELPLSWFTCSSSDSDTLSIIVV